MAKPPVPVLIKDEVIAKRYIPSKTPSPTPPANDKYSWMTQAGIPQELWWAVDYVIDGESDWNPTARNPNSSAFGLGQFLNSTWGLVGCTKTGNPVQQLICADRYAKATYGGWVNAANHWKIHKVW